jgi:hypothetical protein
MLAIPFLILAIALAAFLGPSLGNAMIAIGVTATPIFVRLARRDGKPQYLPHLARVWRLLDRALEHPALAELRAWFDTNVPAQWRTAPEIGTGA